MKPIRSKALRAWNAKVRALGPLTDAERLSAQTRGMMILAAELERRILAGANGDELVAETARVYPWAFGLTADQLRPGMTTEEVWKLIEKVSDDDDQAAAAAAARRRLALAANPSAN